VTRCPGRTGLGSCIRRIGSCLQPIRTTLGGGTPAVAASGFRLTVAGRSLLHWLLATANAVTSQGNADDGNKHTTGNGNSKPHDHLAS